MSNRQTIKNGEIPGGWEALAIERFAETESGGTPSTSEEIYWKDGDVPWLNSGAIQNCVVDKPTTLITRKGLNSSAAKLLPKNTVLIAITGATTGKVGFLNFESSTNQSIVGILPSEKHMPKYLYYYLMFARKQMLRYSVGSAQPHINKKIVDRLRIPLPPPLEQQKIAAILSTVDEVIQKMDEVVRATETLKRGLMQRLLIRGIKHTRFKQTKLGKMPETWRVAKASDVFRIIMGQSPPGSSYNRDGQGLPLLNGPSEFGEISPHPIQWTSRPTKTCVKNDVLLCVRGNTAGRINIADRVYCIGRGIAAIREKKKISDKSFIRYSFEWISTRLLNVASGSGSTFPNIKKTDIENIKIPFPGLDEQVMISRILLTIDEKISNARNKRKILQDLKKGLMQMLLTGKVRVRVS